MRPYRGVRILTPRSCAGDSGRLVFHRGAGHAGLIRLPDVPPDGRITLMQRILDQHSDALERRAMVAVRGDRIRISESD